ncbi:MAG: LysE family translocator [Alphaproteobacteria bacterium]|nr:LysE family translocator [Alphaproteobacteria bacterium]
MIECFKRENITMIFTSLYLPMLGFLIVASFTPGPNNIMLASSGVNFGFTRTIPHMLGVSIGFGGVLLLAGVGLDQIFSAFPTAQQVLRMAALMFITYLAWGIARSEGSSSKDSRGRPQFFWEAASFQLINPKGVVVGVTMVSTFIVPEEPFLGQFMVMLSTGMVIAFLSTMTWAAFGLILGQWVQTPGRLRVFNVTMASLLMLSITPVAIDLFQ